MKTYTIIGGVNGCGKSSLTGVLKSLKPNMGTIIDPDDIAKKSNLSSYEVGRKTIEKTQKCLSENISFTQETTLAGRYTQKVAKQAQSQNYHVRLYYVGLDTLEESLERIQNRVKKAVITFRKKLSAADTQGVFSHYVGYCLTVMKPYYMIIITALQKWLNIGTEN